MYIVLNSQRNLETFCINRRTGRNDQPILVLYLNVKTIGKWENLNIKVYKTGSLCFTGWMVTVLI